jgi:Na+/H+-dicarboxylate symporter
MRKLALHWKIIIGLFLGVAWALISSSLGWSQFTLDWIKPFGTIFINLLKLIAVPLVLFSIIKGVAGISDTSKIGRMGAKTLGIYLFTTVVAISIGLLLVNVIQPGNKIKEADRYKYRMAYEYWAMQQGVEVKDHKNLLSDPDLVAQYMDTSFVKQTQLAVPENFREKIKTAEKEKQKGPLRFLVAIVPDNIFLSLQDNRLMLQIIFFAIFFGLTITFLPKKKTKPVVRFVDSVNEVILKMVDLVMQGAPFFVFALLAGQIAEMAGDNPGSVVEIFKGLGWYALVVLGGLFIMAFVIYPLLFKLLVRKIPIREFFRGIGPAQLLAFSSSSSAATLPVTMDCVRENLGVSKNVTSFVLPIGATVNMDGTSLYQAVAVVFLAQMHWVELTIAQQIVIVITATLASIGTPAVPSAGLVMLIIVLESVGLNPAWIAIIFPIDRILDMCRTVINVTGDATVSTIIAKSENELNYEPHQRITNFDV